MSANDLKHCFPTLVAQLSTAPTNILFQVFICVAAAGYIAPRHMQAIKAIGGDLKAAFDPNDALGRVATGQEMTVGSGLEASLEEDFSPSS